jgi:Fuc2NAc and GlcNAc transferase
MALPAMVFGGYHIDLGWAGHILGLFYLVWLLNLYNFMDGIDGIAGIEAVTVSLGGTLLAVFGTESAGQLWALVLLAVTVTGFLFWNFPPAKIFMGDAGSGFLGIVLGLFSVQAAWNAPQFFWSWLILLSVFIVDASFTLSRRYFRGEKVYQAHRSHAYQYAARFYHAHQPVTLAVGAINIGWLIPIALWVGIGGLDGLWGFVIAYIPVILLVLHFKAGARNTE